MKKSLLLTILFVLLSVVFITYTVFNWTSEIPYDQTHRSQINLIEAISIETQIPENNKILTKSMQNTSLKVIIYLLFLIQYLTKFLLIYIYVYI